VNEHVLQLVFVFTPLTDVTITPLCIQCVNCWNVRYCSWPWTL